MSTALDLVPYIGERVIIKLYDDEEDHNGTIETANEQAVVFKPRGKTAVQLIEVSEFESVNVIQRKEPQLKSRRVNPTKVSSAKRHLLDWHGYALADINAMKPEDAFKFHESIDHSTLGHYHEVKSED